MKTYPIDFVNYIASVHEHLNLSHIGKDPNYTPNRIEYALQKGYTFYNGVTQTDYGKILFLLYIKKNHTGYTLRYKNIKTENKFMSKIRNHNYILIHGYQDVIIENSKTFFLKLIFLSCMMIIFGICLKNFL